MASVVQVTEEIFFMIDPCEHTGPKSDVLEELLLRKGIMGYVFLLSQFVHL